MTKRFKVLLEADPDGSRATGITIPFDVQKEYGTRARVPVRGTLNGAPFRSSIVPMGGRHMMAVPKKLRDAAGVSAGETVTVVMERDTEPRVVTPPADLVAALDQSDAAKAAWAKLSYTHQKEHVQAIEEAKKPETRARRIARTLEVLGGSRK
jgi:bifunctional DNA-binding transcriptional regulator/antitoxin component of YhaV-PrlF toxin-antitoxin module